MFLEDVECGNRIDGIQYRERIGAYALIINSYNKIALVRRDNSYFLPGGGVENNETYEECLKRECSEEIGYNIEIVEYIGKLSNYTVSIKSNEYLKVIGHVYIANLLNINYLKVIGHVYIANLLNINYLKIEEDHELIWIPLNESTDKMQEEFQAYAIKKYIEQQKI